MEGYLAMASSLDKSIMSSNSTEQEVLYHMIKNETWFIHNDWYVKYCPYYHNKSGKCTAKKYVFDKCKDCPKRWVNQIMRSKNTQKKKEINQKCDLYLTDPIACLDCDDKGTGACQEFLFKEPERKKIPRHIRLARRHKKSPSKLEDQARSIREFNKKGDRN